MIHKILCTGLLGLSLLADPLFASEAASDKILSTDKNIQLSWTYDHFINLTENSGRKFNISNNRFDKIRARKSRYLRTIEKYLIKKFGEADSNVLRAFSDVPREYFHFDYEKNRDFFSRAYEENAKPWRIGYGSALSDYLGQAYMTQLANPKPGEIALEIGTGSGFQISILSRILEQTYSIEIIEPLGNAVAKIFGPLGYKNIHTTVGDGYYGWPEVEGGFDIIMVTCSAASVPPPLFKQLKPGGRLIVPIGQPFKRGQVLYIYTKDDDGKIRSKKDMGVYFIPMTGKLLEGKSQSLD